MLGAFSRSKPKLGQNSPFFSAKSLENSIIFTPENSQAISIMRILWRFGFGLTFLRFAQDIPPPPRELPVVEKLLERLDIDGTVSPSQYDINTEKLKRFPGYPSNWVYCCRKVVAPLEWFQCSERSTENFKITLR